MQNTKTKSKKLNVRLLRRIQKHILEEPRRFMMHAVKLFGAPGEIYHSDGFDNGYTRFPSCGTAQCIAGWALTLSGHPRSENMKKAARLLIGKSAYLWYVFEDHTWPEPFATRYRNAKTPLARAKIACKRIDHLIKTGK